MGSTVKGDHINSLKHSGNIMKLYIQCFVYIAGQTALILLYCVHWVDFGIETECVNSAVRIESFEKVNFPS